ncbi:hypothetical protein EMIT0158MI4_70289 [Burkholderia ambifaria]
MRSNPPSLSSYCVGHAGYEQQVPVIIFRKHPREVFGDYVILKEPTFFYNFGDRLNWSIEDKLFLVTLIHYKPYVSRRGRSQLSKMQVATIVFILKYNWLLF